MAATQLGPVPSTSESDPKRQNAAIQTLFKAITPSLQALGTLTITADQYPYATGANAWAAGSIPSYGRSLVASASADAAQTTLNEGFGKFSVNLNGVNMTGLTGGSNIKILFSTKAFDPDNQFSTVNSRYTATRSGYYLFGLKVQASTSASADSVQALIFVNGSLASAGTFTPAASTTTLSTVSHLVNLNGSTDFVEGFVHVPTGTTSIIGAVTMTSMFGWRVSP